MFSIQKKNPNLSFCFMCCLITCCSLRGALEFCPWIKVPSFFRGHMMEKNRSSLIFFLSTHTLFLSLNYLYKWRYPQAQVSYIWNKDICFCVSSNVTHKKSHLLSTMRLQGSYHVADEYAEVPSCFYSELCCFIYTFRNIFLIFFSKVKQSQCFLLRQAGNMISQCLSLWSVSSAFCIRIVPFLFHAIMFNSV